MLTLDRNARLTADDAVAYARLKAYNSFGDKLPRASDLDKAYTSRLITRLADLARGEAFYVNAHYDGEHTSWRIRFRTTQIGRASWRGRV